MTRDRARPASVPEGRGRGRVVRSTAQLAALASLIGILGCTLEPGIAERAPAQILRTTPASGERDVAVNASISFWFDRPMEPASFSEQTIVLQSREVKQSGRISYDPLEQRLTFTPKGVFRRDLAYDAVLEHSRLRDLRHGVRVEPATVTFVTGNLEQTVEQPPAVEFDAEILPVFRSACAGCHSGPRAAGGLDLDTADGVAGTAIGQRTVLGWSGWPRIEAYSAAWSYLVYKLLGEETVSGVEMPPGGLLDRAGVALIIRWIDEGAKVDPGNDPP
jgi:hypothetical protein